ncbi:hypothetical protein TMatcc_011230 [Talaromyces marneffei ATCC 18224]
MDRDTILLSKLCYKDNTQYTDSDTYICPIYSGYCQESVANVIGHRLILCPSTPQPLHRNWRRTTV